MKLNNGRETTLPGLGSIAIDMGNPTDNSAAQNGSFLGIRDVGSAESCMSAVYDTIVSCESYYFGGVVYENTGVYYDSLLNTQGCDSVISLYLTVSSNILDTLPPTIICFSDSVLVFGNYESIAGLYYDSLSNIYGCDSILIQELKVVPVYQDSLNYITTCTNESVLIFGNYQNTSGVYYDSLISINGCDSIIIQELIVNSFYEDTLTTITICEYDSVFIFGNYESTNGLYYDSLTTINGCDSIIIQELIINPIDITTSLSDLTITANQFSATYQWIDCSNGNIVITGATDQAYTATTNGDYAVVVTTANCTDTSDCISINDVSLLENKKESNISVYPNPNTGIFTINFQGGLSKNTEIIIFNVIGEEVVQIKPINDLEKVDLSRFENGVYFVSVTNKSISEVVRIVKQ